MKVIKILKFVVVSIIFVLFIGETAQAQFNSDKSVEATKRHEVKLGSKIAIALLRGCSAYSSHIAHSSDAFVRFKIEKPLRLDPSSSLDSTFVEIGYVRPTTNEQIRSAFHNDRERQYWWFNLDTKQDSEVVLFHCISRSGSNETSFAVSDSSYFSKIDSIVEEYERIIKAPELILQIPDNLRSDAVREAFLIEIATANRSQFSSYQTLALAKILRDKNAFVNHNVRVVSRLSGIMTNPVLSLEFPELFYSSLRILLEIGSSDHSNADEAVMILAGIARSQNNSHLRQSLSPQLATALSNRLDRFNRVRIPEEAFAAFELILREVKQSS